MSTHPKQGTANEFWGVNYRSVWVTQEPLKRLLWLVTDSSCKWSPWSCLPDPQAAEQSRLMLPLHMLAKVIQTFRSFSRLEDPTMGLRKALKTCPIPGPLWNQPLAIYY